MQQKLVNKFNIHDGQQPDMAERNPDCRGCCFDGYDYGKGLKEIERKEQMF